MRFLWLFEENVVILQLLMKRSAIIVCVLLMLNLMVGCLKDEIGGVRITTEGAVELYPVPQQTAMFLFYTGGPWKAATDVSWLKITKESGPGGTDTLFIVTTEKNLTGAVRTAQVTIESDGVTKSVDVRQSGEYAIFDQKEVVMFAEGGPLEVTFRTNVADSLQLYVSGYLAKYLVDTRKQDSTAETRADEMRGSLKWLKVLPNESDSTHIGYFFLSINNPRGGRIDLDTLHFVQLSAGVPVDTVDTVSTVQAPVRLR